MSMEIKSEMSSPIRSKCPNFEDPTLVPPGYPALRDSTAHTPWLSDQEPGAEHKDHSSSNSLRSATLHMLCTLSHVSFGVPSSVQACEMQLLRGQQRLFL